MKASHLEKYIDAGEKNCYFADSLPVYLFITVKTNARVNTRGSKMLPTNRATAGEEVIHRLEPSHYWRVTLEFTNNYCETILKGSDSYSVARLPEHCFTEYTIRHGK